MLSPFYVLGNGPSLTTRIIRALPDGAWLGMNSAFRYWSKIKKYPRYYACLDPVVVKSQIDGIRELLEIDEIKEFFLHDCVVDLVPQLSSHPKVTLLSRFLAASEHAVPFSRLALEKQTTGALATRFVLDRGHRRLTLIGIDCKYVERLAESAQTQGIELVIKKKVENNPNYFFSGYQEAGDKYQVPNPVVHSGNLHLQSFVALRNDLDAASADVSIRVGSDRSLLSRFGIFPTSSIWEELGIRRIGAIALPLTPREWKRQLQNLKLWMDPRFWPSMDAKSKGTCLHLFISGQHDETLKREIEAGLAEVLGLTAFFSTCRITFLDIPPEIDHYIRSTASTDDPCTKSGPNVFFLSTMAHCMEYEYVLHVETDCLPVRPGWLDAAEREIERAGTQAWIIGPAYFGPSSLHSAYRMHINGNAIYQTGDPDFQSFLQGTFLDVLSQLLRSGFRDMAYDTALSVALHNIDSFPEDLRKALYLALPRFNHSNFIRNIGGSRETADPSLLDMKTLLGESDQTFMLHGRPGFHYLDGDRTYLPEVYRTLEGVPVESLPLFYVWTNDSSWQVDQKGYGRVDLVAGEGEAREGLMLTFHFARLRSRMIGRRWQMRMVVEQGLLAFARATFAFSDAEGKVFQVDATVQREADAPGMERLTFELLQCPSFDGDAVGVYLHALQFRPDRLSIHGVSMIEANASDDCQSLRLEISSRSAACVEAIERWQSLYDSLPRFTALVDQPQWVHWQSKSFLLRHAALQASHVTLTAVAALVPAAGDSTGPLFLGVLSGAPWHLADSFRVQIKVSNATVNGDAFVRLCRHAHTPWEYVDIKVPLCAGYGQSAEILAPFTHHHQMYRIELLSIPHLEGALSLSVEIEANLRQQAVTAANLRRSARTPRLLILDPTIMGSPSATGQIKRLFFDEWADADLLQVCELRAGDDLPGLVQFECGKPTWTKRTEQDVLTACIEFKPEVLYVRPIDSLPFMRHVVRLVKVLGRPFAVHIMDDWMERTRVSQPDAYSELLSLLMELIRGADLRLSISRGMSRMLALRYGGHWVPLANGVDVAAMPPAQRSEGPFVLRYMGGLAEDMSLSTVKLVSQAVNSLRTRVDVRFEIYTMPWYQSLAREHFSAHQATSVHDLVAEAEYLPKLASAGGLLIAYNFDENSKRYTRYSFSNKLPECLASGRPVLLVGPEDLCTVQEMREEIGLSVVTHPSVDAVAQVIESLAMDPMLADQIGARGRDVAARRFGKEDVQKKVITLLGDLAARSVNDRQNASPPSVVTFKIANQLMREGKYEQALVAFSRLMAAAPLGVYQQNGLLCIQRLGLDEGTWIQAVDVARIASSVT